MKKQYLNDIPQSNPPMLQKPEGFSDKASRARGIQTLRTLDNLGNSRDYVEDCKAEDRARSI